MTESDRPPEHDATTATDGRIRVDYDWSSTAPSTAVVETVAVAANTQPTELDPLYDSVDPDAVDTLMRSDGSQPDGEITVCFSFADHHVTMYDGGTVVVEPSD